MMIYTLTLSPSIDYYARVSQLDIGKVNRGSKARFALGGKGINVARHLQYYGEDVQAIILYGGEIGHKILSMVKEVGLSFCGIETAGESRINIKLKAAQETAINLPAPVADAEAISSLKKTFANFEENSSLIISGQIGQTLGEATVLELMEIIKSKNIRLILDISDRLMLKLLDYHPFLIKPNLEELETIAGIKIHNDISFQSALKYLYAKGAEQIIVSLGDKGAYFYSSWQKQFFVPAPAVSVCHTVGAGDALLAAYIHSYGGAGQEKNALEAAVRYAARLVEEGGFKIDAGR